MGRAFRYNLQQGGRCRPPRDFGRWLAVYGGALARLCRPGRVRLLWTEDASAALLAAGFPGLLAVPEALFAETAALFPDRCRLGAARTEEESLAALRLVEERRGVRFDWDAFLAACERRNRRARRLIALADRLCALADRQIDTRTPTAALRSLTGKD